MATKITRYDSLQAALDNMQDNEFAEVTAADAEYLVTKNADGSFKTYMSVSALAAILDGSGFTSFTEFVQQVATLRDDAIAG